MINKIIKYLCIFIVFFFIGWGINRILVPHFYEVHQKTIFKQKEPIKKDAITINNCAEREMGVGEVFLGKALQDALKLEYKDVRMDYRLSMYPKDKNDEINIYLRGYFKFTPPFPDKQHINIAYILYPLFYTKPNRNILKNRDKISIATLENGNIAIDELQYYDILAVASKPYTEKLKKAGFNAYYIPQLTDTKKFYREYVESLKSEVLFVGTKRNYASADIALENDLPIAIYGPGWGSIAKKEYIDNNELHKYYSSAKIVLNDHRDDMRSEGFINNRTFDVTATGSFLISDYMPEIEEIYGDAIPMWKTPKELVELVQYYLSHDEERKAKAKKAQAITLKYFTTQNIAQAFKKIIDQEKNKH